MCTQSSRLSVVIPAFNAAGELGATLQAVLSSSSRGAEVLEVIVVDDGSTDETRRLTLQAAVGDERVRLVSHDVNRGKGAAVRTGLAEACGDRMLFMDADSSAGIDQWPRLRTALDAGADVAIGSRDLEESSRVVDQSSLRRWLGQLYRRRCRRRLGIDVRDPQCGFKAFTREAARIVCESGRIDRWAFDTEILVIARERGLQVTEVPILWRDAEGSSLSPWRDGFGVWRDLMRIRRMQRTGTYR